jgi:MFS family permease
MMIGPADGAPLLGGRRGDEGLSAMLPGAMSVLVFGYVSTVFATVLPLWSAKWGKVGAICGGAIESVNLVGAVFGLLIFGMETERRDPAGLALAACGCCVVGGVLSAAFPGALLEAAVEKSGFGMFATFGGWGLLATRFLSGFGAGGLYTLGASLEHRRSADPAKVGLVSCGISGGSLLIYAVGTLLLVGFGMDAIEIQWRLTFCFGALLALGCGAAIRASYGGRLAPARHAEAPSLARVVELAEAAGLRDSAELLTYSWFLQNVGNFGVTTIFPFILADAMDVSLATNFALSLAVGVVSTLACCASLVFVRRHPGAPEDAVVEAYVACVAVLLPAAVVGAALNLVPAASLAVFVVLRVIFGVPVTALYAFPTTVAPDELGGPLHGACAGVAKLGSVLGTIIFYPIYVSCGKLTLEFVGVAIFVGAYALAVLAARAYKDRPDAARRATMVKSG